MTIGLCAKPQTLGFCELGSVDTPTIGPIHPLPLVAQKCRGRHSRHNEGGVSLAPRLASAQLVGYVLHEVLDAAPEVDTKLVQHVRSGAVALQVQDLRQGRAVDARRLRDLLDRDATGVPKLLLLELLGQLEPDHGDTLDNQTWRKLHKRA